VIECPRCSRLFHQDTADEAESKHCWSYREQCFCGHPTDLSDERTWHPDWEQDHA
jgi:hypothetical protein